MRQHFRGLAIAGCLTVAIAVLACSGSGGGGTTGPSPGPTERGPSASATPSSANARIIDLSSTSPTNVIYAVAQGDLRSDQPGLAVGDFNDDGFDDIVVGARFADGPDDRLDSGAAYVIFGSADPPPSLDLAEGGQDVTILGPNPESGLGFSAAAADLNGDGLDDIVLGAPFTNADNRTPGAAYVLFAPLDANTIDLANGEADVAITGTATDAFFGDSLAAGDVNGDGTADLIVGATFGSGPGGNTNRGGAVYTFLGREEWPAALSPAEADVSFFGAEEFDELGDFVTSGDINGDGFDDIIATAEAADGPDNARQTAAEVHVLFGAADLSGTFEIARGQQDLSVYGANSQDTLGFSLASADLDGDGIDDLVMGARLASGPNNAIPRAGQVYVLFGREDLPDSVDLLQIPDLVSAIHAPTQSEFLGTSEAVADLDGDGDGELIMGASSADAPSHGDAGIVYVAEGPLETPAGQFVSVDKMPLLAVVYGAADADRFGGAVSAGDFNGDGRLELIAVAMDAAGPDGQRPGAGRVYVIQVGG